jgi:sigma-B regulation protein RsbU (phosphoserine phosphatase)
MQTPKTLLPFFLLLVVSLVLIVWLVPVVHPYGGIRLPLDVKEIIQHSRSILHDVGVDESGLATDVQFQTNRSLLRQAQRTFGIERSNLFIRDSIPAYFWSVHWTKERHWNFSFGNNGTTDKQVEDIAEILRGDIRFQFDTHGDVLEFTRKVPDSTKLPSLSQEGAKALASAFLRKYTAIGNLLGDTSKVISEKKIEQPFRTDYEMTWSTVTAVLHDPVKAKITVAGNIVAKFEADPIVPAQFAESDSDSIFSIFVALLYVAIGIAMVVIAFKRFRSYEIGFRLALIIGITAGILTDIEIFLSIRNEIKWEILFPLILAPLFVGGALVLIWAVCETVVRESWKEKFVSLDLLTKGHLFHSRIGANVIRGIVLGCSAFALWLVLVKLGGLITPLWTTNSNDNAIHTFDLSAPWLYVVGQGIYSTLFVYTFCILFALSFLRKYVSSGVLLVVLGAVVLGVMNPEHLHPFSIAMLVSVLVSAISVWTFYRFDALAAFLAMFTLNAAQEVAGFFVVGNPTYYSSGLILVILTGIVLVVAVVMAFRKEEVTDFDEITPSFARHITERQRLQQELEIARNVQMSFLPKKNPVSSTLDIASRCAPALEVGGDYYDFIDLGGQRVGVAIGDVSGKGTQAAFFMTLTKGFLNALAHVSVSPSQVLTQVNKLFYENVERGVFISMVYGIFDTEANSLTLARAGHNPVIMRKSKENHVQVVNPTGLALGLDEGSTFAKSIQEVKTKLQSGDLFVFYTDGFPEAMNKTMEEFGEARLLKTVENYSDGSASEIMEGIFKEMKEFTGKAKQHDDMTIVVVKIK